MNSRLPYLLRATYEWIVENNCTPYLVVDANQPNVSVPRQFVKEGQITLNVSMTATQHLEMDNEAVAFSARFSGRVEHIYVPVEAILAIYARENGEGLVFGVIEDGARSDVTVDSMDELHEPGGMANAMATPKQLRPAVSLAAVNSVKTTDNADEQSPQVDQAEATDGEKSSGVTSPANVLSDEDIESPQSTEKPSEEGLSKGSKNKPNKKGRPNLSVVK